MAKMKLYYSPSSPYARKVRIVAIEAKLDKKIDMVNVALTPVAPNADVDKHNPVGKVPALSVKGMDLFDSPVICEYLDTLHGGPKLFPEWPERLVALRRLALGDGMLDIALTWLGERFRPAEKQSEPHMKLWEAKLRCCADALEQEADGLAASRLSIGHVAIGNALSYLDFRFGDLNWRNGHPRLTAWHMEFDSRPSVRANPPVDDR